MKKIIFSLMMFTTLSITLNAQVTFIPETRVGISYSSFGENIVDNAAHSALIGGPSYFGHDFYAIGASYIRSYNKHFELEAGLEYAKHTISVSPPPYVSVFMETKEKSVSMLNIPVTARFVFLKYFNIHGGIMAVTETGASSPIDNQTGLGALFGVGAHYRFVGGPGIFIQGYNKYYALLPFMGQNDDYRNRLTEAGIRLGVTYTL